MNTRERIVIIEGIDERDIPVREVVPSTELVEWRGCGPARGEYEAAVHVEYLPPRRRAA